MTSFSVPFALTSTGAVTTATDPNIIANQRVNSLVGTYPGERVMLPDYGVDGPASLFLPTSNVQQDVIVQQVRNAMAQWEPTIILNDVTVDNTQQEFGISNVNITFTLSNNPNLTQPQTAVVEVGGKVIG